jgi:hypothetical protein
MLILELATKLSLWQGFMAVNIITRRISWATLAYLAASLIAGTAAFLADAAGGAMESSMVGAAAGAAFGDCAWLTAMRGWLFFFLGGLYLRDI